MSTTTAAPPQQTLPTPLAAPDRERTRRLGRYRALDTAQQREVLRIQQPDGSALVVDYQLGTLSDGRMVAQLAAKEPAENARVVCDLYLADPTRGHCRAVTPQDFQVTPAHTDQVPSTSVGETLPSARLRDAEGYLYTLREIPTDPSKAPELRWTRSQHPGCEPFDAVTLRDVIGGLQAYEPARTLTRDALGHCPVGVCVRRLRYEAQRLDDSAIVLNRGLREAIQRELRLGTVTMSDIAARCGRFRDRPPGSCAGDTTWLARRVGEVPEGGQQRPCPWIRSELLALIARDGLGVSPREVEL